MRKLLFLAGLLFTVSLSAQNWQVRLRGVSVQPYEKSTVGGEDSDVNISNAFIPELDFTYFFNKNFAAELILGTSKHDVKVGNDEVSLGSVRLLPPTVTLQYHFYPTKSLKPYVGAGLNYTIFYDVENGDTLGMDYKNNVGIALQGGVDYFVNDKFFLNVDIKKLYLQTDVDVDLGLPATVPAEVKINPLLIGFGVGMKF
ncbi:OmpW/AlkL family protein [Cloacibacterium normanense]|uniref:Outer membrane insertion C-terminal signal domain protein n=1 Tax=Cloacibacterium normanense TaxID=237258 RepID=A0A1E5UC56_9FLAO|nr:OmpW family outer membrane protein [Cloacibacterium normanense]AZI70498.1 OmpW family protein [Cloacibacterium normanense]OEL10514.1 outer membrane insertion C-terminal signal domain protein [Cloacibacterium normanense]SDO27064.1 outer membrane protein [Cloacibacterium normanense]